MQTQAIFELICAPPASGGLGVRVEWVDEPEPYTDAKHLCSDLRLCRRLRLGSRGAQPSRPHPLLDSGYGGTFDQLRVVHDVLGHAALGVGFDLFSEWLTYGTVARTYCDAAQPALATELLGAVASFIESGQRQVLKALAVVEVAPAYRRVPLSL